MINLGFGETYAAILKEVDDLKTKLNAIEDKYRWRKQSEEPAPDDTMLLWAVLFSNGYHCVLCMVGDLIDGFGMMDTQHMYWRYPDLPEEESK